MAFNSNYIRDYEYIFKIKKKYVSFYGNAQGNFYNLINIPPKDPLKFGNSNSDDILFFDKNLKSLFLSFVVPRKKLKRKEKFYFE